MPSYRVHRLKDHLRQQFRYAAHVSGAANLKPRDYEVAGDVEGSSPYAAYFLLKDTEVALQPGDLLEAPDQSLRIYKYVGFEEARWVLPEAKTEEPAVTASSTAPSETQGREVLAEV
jgi:hypothetical protein